MKGARRALLLAVPLLLYFIVSRRILSPPVERSPELGKQEIAPEPVALEPVNGTERVPVSTDPPEPGPESISDIAKYLVRNPFTGKSSVQNHQWSMTLSNVCLWGRTSDNERSLRLYGARIPKGAVDASPPGLFTFITEGSPSFADHYFFPETTYYLPNSYNIAHDLADSFIVMYDHHFKNPPPGPVRLMIHHNLSTPSWLYSLASTMLAPSEAVRDPEGTVPVCFERLFICGKDRHYSSSPGLLSRFRQHVLQRLGIPTNLPTEDSGLSVLVYTRAEEHRRRVLNTDALVAAVQRAAEKHPLARVNVHHTYLTGFRAQVQLYARTAVLVGVTGGSQTNTVFMDHASGAVVELLPCQPAGVSWLHFLKLWTTKHGNHLPLLNCPSAPEVARCMKRSTEKKCNNPRNWSFNVTNGNLKVVEQFLDSWLGSLSSLVKRRSRRK